MDAAMPPAGTPDPEWVATPEGYYPDRYKVTACGRVESVPRTARDAKGRLRRYKRCELKVWIGNTGYPMVTLSGGRRDDRKSVPVHVLVKEAFDGPTPPGMEICHGDGVKTNCNLYNLIFGTSAENKADIKRHGRNYWLNRDRCDYGHRLDGANVVVRNNADGTTRRCCVACKRARSARDHLRKTGRDGNLREIADRKYAEIMAGTDGRHTAGAAIITCPQGHLLIAPNLVTSNPGRTCLACNRTHSLKAHARKTGKPFDFQAVSDEKYATIMADVPLDVLEAARHPPAVPAVEIEPYVRQSAPRRARRAPTPSEPIPDLPGEEWLFIPGWEGSHMVSNLMRVKSLDRWVPWTGQADRWCHGKLFTLTPDRNGYPVVGLPDRTAKSGSRTHLVHLLVMLAFKGPTPDGMEVLHGDGNPWNARLDNLRFGTHAENQQEMVLHGNGPGDRHAREARGLIGVHRRGRRHDASPSDEVA